MLLDTPGLRGFALWNAEAGLGDVFADIAQLASQCRFADCAHASEPGCSVRAALADGTLEERRWASYLRMLRELAALHRRQDALARKEWHREAERRLHTRSQRDAYRRRIERGQ